MRRGISSRILIITIVVLIIFAVSVIVLGIGENGILNKAATRNDKQTAQEKVLIGLSDIKVVASVEGKNIYEYLETMPDALKEKDIEYDKENSANEELIFYVNDYIIITNNVGNIINVYKNTY